MTVIKRNDCQFNGIIHAWVQVFWVRTFLALSVISLLQGYDLMRTAKQMKNISSKEFERSSTQVSMGTSFKI